MASGHITSWQIDGETMETVTDFIFLGSKNHSRYWLQPWNLKIHLHGRKAMTNLDSILKSRHYFADKCPYNQSYGLSSNHVWMSELDHKKSWAPKSWFFWAVVLEKTLESLLYCTKITPVHPKGNWSWIFNGRTDAEAVAPKLWPPDGKNWLIGKDLDAGKDWRQEQKGTAEHEMVGWLTDSMDMSSSKLQELVIDREAWSAAVHGVTKSQTQLSDWTELYEYHLLPPTLNSHLNLHQHSCASS